MKSQIMHGGGVCVWFAPFTGGSGRQVRMTNILILNAVKDNQCHEKLHAHQEQYSRYAQAWLCAFIQFCYDNHIHPEVTCGLERLHAALSHRFWFCWWMFGCVTSTSALRWAKQMKIIWTLAVNAKSASSTPLASSSHVIPYQLADPRLLVLPTGFSSTKDCLIRLSQVAATEKPICLWLLTVTYTITQLLPVIKATLLFLGHSFLLLLRLFLQSSTCPPPLATYFRDCIMKSSYYLWNPPVHTLYTHMHNSFSTI